MRWNRVLALVGLLLPVSVQAQELFKLEPLKEAPPAALAGPIKEALNAEGIRVVDDQGKPYADIWFRKATPAAGKPGGPQGPILFPTLKTGELIGALRFAAEGRDFRDQAISKGVYTLRYGLQPMNGDHLGASPFRDFALLLPAAKDKTLGDLAQKPLHEESAESAGTSHPAILMLLEAPESAPKGETSIVHDEEKNTWGVVSTLNLVPKGETAASPLPVQLVVIGVAAN
ncbi:hypothetical protein SAMN05444166_5940 [Singulisphaera sp. GP187]|uniref:hypothetical protein n=1 Tax=Singulisphaera sp. GP187 TaxID=1882752 RepID=UPI0009282111|nr:hypothetical protein [Singulisphaera sp. GP187]SIO59142.1 hypothetical protein SAMN05444166_5940 [Singulisphaera sp. GP187]